MSKEEARQWILTIGQFCSDGGGRKHNNTNAGWKLQCWSFHNRLSSQKVSKRLDRSPANSLTTVRLIAFEFLPVCCSDKKGQAAVQNQQLYLSGSTWPLRLQTKKIKCDVWGIKMFVWTRDLSAKFNPYDSIWRLQHSCWKLKK